MRAEYKLQKGALFDIKLPAHPNSLVLRAGTSDAAVLRQIFIDEELSFPMPPKPSFIIDAGANIGLTSIYFARRFPDAKIVALEIDSGNFTLLEQNIAPYRNIVALKKALWPVVGYVRVTNPSVEPWAYQVEETDASDVNRIQTISVDNLLTEFNPKTISVLKMDIEGAEKEVLNENSSSWMGRIEVLAVELHDRYTPGCSAALDNALRGRKYQRKQSGEYDVIYFTEINKSACALWP